MNRRTAPTRRVAHCLLLAALACLAFAGIAQAKTSKGSSGTATAKKSAGTDVTLMTRNLYLGADLGPAISSTSTAGFIEANGGILRQVEATNFPVRAKGLAKEILSRLTMRDGILARVGAGVKTSRPESDNFGNLLVVKVAGSQEVTINRDWASVNATVRGSKPFRFVDTHFESFDDRNVYPSIRAQQAGELVAPGGPATGKLPVILVGDLNSDLETETAIGDGQAYRVMVKAGFRERSTYEPLNCCIEESNFDLTGGNRSEFDHKVDHVMTNAPKAVKLVESGVTGRRQQNGYWDSDHAGLFSVLNLLR